MSSNNETLYRPYGLGWKDCQELESPRGIAGIVRGLIRTNPRLVVAAILGLTGIGAREIYTRVIQHTPPTTITAGLAVWENTEGAPQVVNLLNTLNFVKRAQALLETPGLDMNRLGFRNQMQKEGYILGEFEVFGACSRTGIAGEKGLYVRRVPSSNNEEFPLVGTINYGEPVFWIAEIPVTRPDGSRDVFGLLQDPLRVTPINDPNQIPSAPNLFATEDGVVQVEPGYVRLRYVALDGTTTWFVKPDPQNGSINLTSDQSRFSGK